MDKTINQHKRMAMGEKITGMKKGGKVPCVPDKDMDAMKKGGKVKGKKC